MKISPMSRIGRAAKLMILWVILILGLSGCGQEPQQGLPGGAAPAVIELWHSLQGAEAEALSKESQRIMSAHPEVIIRLDYIPEENFVNQTYQAQAGGEGPDIFLTTGEILNQIYQKGALAPVLASSDSFPGVMAAFHHGEHDYAQPVAADIPLFYYRTDKAEPPAGLADFLTAKGILALPALDMKMLSPWWSGQGGGLVNMGQPALEAPANLLFIQQLLAWRDAKLLLVDPNAWQLFVSGQVAYTVSWAGYAKSLVDPAIPWGTMLPTNLTGGQGQILPGRILGLANSSIKPSEILDPLVRMVEEELLNPDSQWAIAQAGNRFPVSQSFYKRAEAQSGILQQVNQGLAKTWPLKGSALEWKLIPLQDQAWQKVWGGSAPEEALSAAQAEAVKVLSSK